MSNPNDRKNLAKALRFTVWKTGDETSQSSPVRLETIIKKYQQQLANERGEKVSWDFAVQDYFDVLHASFADLVNEAQGECALADHVAGWPDADFY